MAKESKPTESPSGMPLSYIEDDIPHRIEALISWIRDRIREDATTPRTRNPDSPVIKRWPILTED